MLGAIIQWASVVKDTATHPSLNQPKLLAWMGCLSVRLLPVLLIVWLGLLYRQKGAVCKVIILVSEVNPYSLVAYYWNHNEPLIDRFLQTSLCNLQCFLVEVTNFPFYDRQLISWHRPYCVDLGESTFGVLKTFLESNMQGMLQEQLAAPFTDTRYM